MGVMGALKDPDSDWSAWDYIRDVCHQLRKIVDNTDREPDDTEARRIRRGFVFQLDGSGNGSVVLTLNPGNSLALLTYAYQVGAPGPLTGYLAFYRDTEEGTGLVLSTGLVPIANNDFNSMGHFLPAQTQFLIVVRGGPAGAVVSGNVTGINNVTRPRLATKGGGEF